MHVVSVQTSNEKGGGEFANVDLLEGLHHRGWRVRLVTNFPELADGTPVPVTPIDLGPKLSASSVATVGTRFGLYVARLRRTLAAEAAREPIDAVLLHYKKEQVMTRLLPRDVAGRVVWAEWGPLPYDFRTGVPRRVYAASARRVSHVVCISENTQDTIVDGGVPRARTSVIPNLVDTSLTDLVPEARARWRAQWGADADTFVVGCVSRFQRKKRNDVVIDAMAHVPEDRPVLLVFFGEGDEEPALRERAARYGARVRFEPNPRGYVEEVLSACDVQVFAPSPTEGAPRSVILGQLCRRPIVATDAEGAGPMIPAGSGTVVTPGHDPAALAEVLLGYAADPERVAREGEAARAVALARYDPQVTLDRWAAVLSGTA